MFGKEPEIVGHEYLSFEAKDGGTKVHKVPVYGYVDYVTTTFIAHKIYRYPEDEIIQDSEEFVLSELFTGRRVTDVTFNHPDACMSAHRDIFISDMKKYMKTIAENIAKYRDEFQRLISIAENKTDTTTELIKLGIC